VATLWDDARQRTADTARVVRANVQASHGPAGGDLPTVGAVDLATLRVHTAVVDVPYLARDDELQLRELLRQGRPALLVGSSMVGKTRMAAEVVKDLFPERPILIPDSKKALAALDAADLTVTGCVIWLDDLDRLIGADGVSDGALRRHAAGNVIVATLRATLYDRYLPTDQLRSPEWDVIAVFSKIVLDRGLSHREQRHLALAVDDEQVRRRIGRVGLGEYVGAAEQVSDQLRISAAANPVGYALVRGAADWRRIGITRPVPADLLPALARPHLDPRHSPKLDDPTAYRAAVDWATREINPTVRYSPPTPETPTPSSTTPSTSSPLPTAPSQTPSGNLASTTPSQPTFVASDTPHGPLADTSDLPKKHGARPPTPETPGRCSTWTSGWRAGERTMRKSSGIGGPPTPETPRRCST
jgi:hypothetical protein